jgi:chemotaxis protein histidine kinase CheA
VTIDREKYIGKYIDEGLENITLIESLVFDIKDGISVDDDLATLLRSLHTLKGTSRMLEFKRIEELSHVLESVFIALKEQRIGFSENAMKLILAALDLVKEGFGIVQRTKDDVIEIQEYVKKLNALAANEEFTLPETEKHETRLEKLQEQKVFASASTSSKDAKSDSIRLSLEKIDGIIKSIASLQSLEVSTKSIFLNSSVMNDFIKKLTVKLRADKNLDPSLVVDFRKLERLSDRLNSALKNHSLDAGNSIRSAYDTVISLRTVPLSTILDGYPRYVFQLSDELGKKVHLEIEGKENEIDKNIIESLSDVFMHMVRNAIDHGIETPKERLTAGKSETGKLTITCSRESGNMKIIITDDGCGIDHEKIREKAVREGFVSEAAAALLVKEDLTNFIFQSGFSTSGKLSNVSGRGVGMNVVRESIEAMKGSIIVESVMGKGTVFTFIVPLSIAALMGFPISSEGMKFIIPANFVETIMLISRDDIITVVDRPEIKYNGRFIKLYYLSQILQIKTDSVLSEDVFVVIIRAYDDIAALVVDDINAMRSVVLKTMPAFMEKMPVFSGLIFNEDYEMVSVLHIPTIIKIAKRLKTIDLKKRNVNFEKLRKSILVVDDSLPTREIENEILSSEGYHVDMAADGAEALKAAKTKHYDLICTDINMPVMDGFVLTENIKKNEALSHIPIIVISSRESEEDQKRAAKLGVSRYIVKNSFNNHNLLEAVRDLIGGTNE